MARALAMPSTPLYDLLHGFARDRRSSRIRSRYQKKGLAFLIRLGSRLDPEGLDVNIELVKPKEHRNVGGIGHPNTSLFVEVKSDTIEGLDETH